MPPPVRQPWFGVACCPANIARTLASVEQYIFASLETRVRDNPVKLDLHSALMQTGAIRLRIPRELDEAATIDGAGHFRILVSIIMPAIKSAMIVVALLLFIQMWNDLLQQIIYINSDSKFTIAIGLSQFKGSLKSDWSAIMCATCMSFVPGVVFYLFGQKYFVEGIVMTGMKN